MYLKINFINAKSQRYVKEWLCLMSCAEIIECDPSGQKFWIPKHHFPALIGREFDDNGERNLENIALMAFMPLMATMFDKVCAVFKLDGPIGLLIRQMLFFY